MISNTLKTLTIQEVKPGMYISELDIPLIKIPFFRHRRLIHCENDIKLLQGVGVKQVVVDTAKSQEAAPLPSTQPHNPPNKTTPSPLQREIQRATAIEQQALPQIGQAHHRLNSGDVIEVHEFTPLIDKVIASLDRNNRALLALFNKSQENDHLAAHHFRVLSLAVSIGKKIGFDEHQIEQLAIAALLHDAGWVQLPKQLMGKGKPYRPAERKLVEQHIAILLNAMLQDSHIPAEITSLIQQHHERGDGSGYPKGLTLYQIKPAARLLAICDYYDELTHGLGEQPGTLPNKALAQLFKEASKDRFDEKMVTEMIHLIGVYPIGSAVQLKSGEKGVVIELREESPLKPTLAMVYDTAGNPLSIPMILDLSAEPDGADERAIAAIIDPNSADTDPFKLLNWDLIEHG